MKLFFAGGAHEVGASCILLTIDGKNILLDAGMRQGAAKDPLPDFAGIQDRGGFDAVLISHAHMDHIGSLPLISRFYPQAPVYMTPMTVDLSRVLLKDSLKLMEKEDDIPKYSEEDVNALFSRILPIRYRAPLEILPGITVSAYPAGHIAGAACLYIRGKEGAFFYSGDLSGFAQQTIEGANIPRIRPDAAIFESTYGNRLHANRDAQEARLVEAAAETILAGGKVLIPAFALGRSQEVLLILRKAFQDGRLPKVPVYVDGMVRDINIAYYRNEQYLKRPLAKRIERGEDPFYSDQIQAVKPTDNRKALVSAPGPAIFVSSSGMLSGGPSVIYAKALAAQKNACILITGYQDEESPGRALLNLLRQSTEDPEGKKEKRKLLLDGVSVKVECRVEQVSLSAHADQGELTALADRIGARHVILVHGDDQAVSCLADEMIRDPRRLVYTPSTSDDVEIVLHNPRKQLEDQLISLEKVGLPTTDDLPELLRAWSKTCFGRALSIDELAFLWTTERLSEEAAEEFSQILLASGLVKRHSKRWFLYQQTTEEERKAFTQKETEEKIVTMQDVTGWIEQRFAGMPYRKIKFFQEEKQAELVFDFPDAQDSHLIAKANEELEQELGWTLTMFSNINLNAANALLSKLFGGRLSKTSFYANTRSVIIVLSASDPEDGDRLSLFAKETGCTISVKGREDNGILTPVQQQATPNGETNTDWFFPAEQIIPVEQNQLFSSLPQWFADGDLPGKKGMKRDGQGVYLELTFITPEIGRKNAKILQELANESGWRVHIAENVNLQALGIIAVNLAQEYGIAFRKNPSWIENKRAIVLKTEQVICDEAKERFLQQTGVRLLNQTESL